MTNKELILTAQCDDRPGLVASISKWIFQRGGNILHLDQHVDSSSNRFFLRIHWSLDNSDENNISLINKNFSQEIGDRLNLEFSLAWKDNIPQMAIFVTKLGHCLWDILSRYESSELQVKIPLIISNHKKYQELADKFEIPYFFIAKNKNNKIEQERKELAILTENKIDFIVLARYMQILSPQFVSHFPNRIINIHHSFLPAFPGAKPYHRAHDRGVKLIGATAHYVTSDLDEGPIIEQDTIRITHRDSVNDLIRNGRDLEKVVLSRAIRLHVNRQVMVHDNRTLVFG